MAKEFSKRNEVGLGKIPNSQLWVDSAYAAIDHNGPALDEFQMRLFAKEFAEVVAGNHEPDDPAIVAEGFSVRSGIAMKTAILAINTVCDEWSLQHSTGAGVVSQEMSLPVFTLHTWVQKEDYGDHDFLFADHYVPMGYFPVDPTECLEETTEEPPFKIVGKGQAEQWVVEKIEGIVRQYAKDHKAIFLTQPLGLENKPSYLAIKLVETKAGYCAHRFSVEFSPRFAELVTTAPEPDKVLSFVKKD